MGAPKEIPEMQTFNNNKRSNKPLMERKRRERINKSLDELKDIILKAQNKDVSKYSKLEKADILEMTVQHVTNLHKNSITSDGVTKYRSGFSHCTSEVESYLAKIQDFPPNICQGLISHLHKVLNSVAKENIPQTNQKIKATTDKSILGLRSIRPKRSYPLESICPQFGSEGKPRIQATTVDVPCLQSPPSDCSMSPHSQELTAIVKYEMEPRRTNFSFPAQYLQENRSAFTCNYLPREAKPRSYEQFVHKTTSPFISKCHSLPRSFCAQEPTLTHNLPPTPPSEQLSPISRAPVTADALLTTSSTFVSRAQCLKDKQRPTPYPKKDAVKRYHDQILKKEIDDSLPEGDGRENGDNSSNDHWRPW